MTIRHLGAALVALAGLAVVAATPAAADVPCAAPDRGLGVARVVEIDSTGGPIYGAITRFSREASFLGPKEVVLTFDDGPAPSITRSVLATLDQFCTKATFFQVGRMAIAYPSMVREVMARGHTVGTHTWSHPLSLGRLKPEAARDEIERGFAAVQMAAGQPIAPFFRFPGLGDNQKLLQYLQSRGIGTFSVDVISNDSFIASTERLIKTTLERVEQRQGGIILFHDIKPQTAKALPVILAELKARGYKVVHLRSRHGFEPDLAYSAALAPLLAKATKGGDAIAVPQPQIAIAGGPPVTQLAPPARPITIAAAARHAGDAAAGSHGDAGPRNPIIYGGWQTTVRKPRTGHVETD